MIITVLISKPDINFLICLGNITEVGLWGDVRCGFLEASVEKINNVSY